MLTQHPAWCIMRKEVREALRDRKTLVIMLALPLVLYPLLFLAVGQATQIQRERLDREALEIAVSGQVDATGVMEHLEAIEATSWVRVDDAEVAVKQGRVSAGVAFSKAFSGELSGGKQSAVRVYYDGADERSQVAEQRLAEGLQAFAEEIREERLRGLGVTPEYV